MPGRSANPLHPIPRPEPDDQHHHSRGDEQHSATVVRVMAQYVDAAGMGDAQAAAGSAR